MRRHGVQSRHDTIVVGGGTIGLSVAWRAAACGIDVAVVDPSPGQGASWAAAGMLAPVGEVHYGEEALVSLNVAAAGRWPAFAAELESCTGRHIGYLQCGTLLAAFDEGDRAWAEQLFAFQKELGLDVEWISGRKARELEPRLSPSVRAGMLASGDHQVDNRLLVGALLEAARISGCKFYDDTVDSLETTGGRVEGVRLRDGTFLESRAVVLASGAWSGQIAGVPEALRPPVRPVKGQIIRLRVPDSSKASLAILPRRPVRGIVNGAAIYLVPRADGTLVIGSTIEEKGFDTSVTAGAVYELLRDAHRVMPAISELDLYETMARLRPGSPDNAPIVGELSSQGTEGLVVATGHYRNGILLTPLTSEAVVATLNGSELPAEIKPFSPSRFGTARPRPTDMVRGWSG